MRMLRFLGMGILLVLAACSSPSSPASTDMNPYHIIPKPVSLEPREAGFTLNAQTAILLEDPSLTGVATYFRDWLMRGSGTDLQIGEADGTPGIVMGLDTAIQHAEGYTLEVSPAGIVMKGKTPKGVFYAVQSLRQMLPLELEKAQGWRGDIPVPGVYIRDEPRYVYRGMHLDVGRHFFPVDFIKRFIDEMALHKLNTFHWHLTEDQGWRIEIKQYPKLQEVAAYRDETLVGHYRDMPHQFDGVRYGGYYTQEEVKEVVAYAQARQIEVIPEIEMPGHAMAALAAYPELACTDGPIEVAKIWGVHEEIFCPTEETFTFLENVLTEVMELFPSEYIHIGGDEAPKKRWEESAFVQTLMKERGLKDEMEVQSYFIQRIEQFVNTEGKRIIGWDEILEGGLAPNATVMSWRGMEGGIEAAEQGHDVIMTPTSHVYFDYYQADPEGEPLAIGGNLPIEKVYSLNPTPEALDEAHRHHILGAQGNLWTEYINTPEKVEYMVFPRASALAEVVWTPQEARDWSDFAERLEQHIARLQAMGVNTATHIFNVKAQAQPDPAARQLKIALETVSQRGTIRYTLDGSDPTEASTEYTEPFVLSESRVVKAASFDGSQLLGKVSPYAFTVHQATALPVSLTHAPSEKYKAGPYVLTDGVRGSDIFNDLWYGFDGTDFEAVIDLGEVRELQAVSFGVLHTTYAWIFYPRAGSVAVSTDGVQYELVDTFDDPSAVLETTPVGKKEHRFSLNGMPVRYIQLKAQNTAIPAWHGGQGKGSWLFVDEVVVE